MPLCSSFLLDPGSQLDPGMCMPNDPPEPGMTIDAGSVVPGHTDCEDATSGSVCPVSMSASVRVVCLCACL